MLRATRGWKAHLPGTIRRHLAVGLSLLQQLVLELLVKLAERKTF